MGVLYQLGGGVGVNDGGHAGIDQEDACLLPQLNRWNVENTFMPDKQQINLISV